MHITITDLQGAVSEAFSPRLADLVPAAVARLYPQRTEIEDSELGLLLAVCLFGGDPGPARDAADALFLTRAEVQAPAGYLALDATDAVIHPLLANWAPVAFADALAAPVLAGLLLNGLGAGAPIYRTVDLIDVEGRGTCGTANLWFEHANAEVCLHYGDTDEVTTLTTSRRCPGASLVAIGSTLREGPSVTAASAFGAIVADAISAELADSPVPSPVPSLWGTLH